MHDGRLLRLEQKKERKAIDTHFASCLTTQESSVLVSAIILAFFLTALKSIKVRLILT